MPEPLLVEHRGPVALLALNRPEKANAYHRPMLGALRDELHRLRHDPDTRALVLHAGTSRHFCAGADRDELDRRTPEEAVCLLAREVFEQLARFPRPTVAALKGAVLGGGLELALAADLRVGAPDLRLGFPETSLGLIPAAGGCHRAPRILGPALAREMILFGRELDAEEALLHRVVSMLHDDPLQAALQRAQQAASRDPLATRLAKQALDLAVPEGAALHYEGAAEAALYAARQPR